jgi:hypothetical protein
MPFVQALHAVPSLQKNSLVKLWWKGFQHTSSSLKSAYATVLVSGVLYFLLFIIL